ELPWSSAGRAHAVYRVYRGLGEAMRAAPEPVAELGARVASVALTTGRRDSRANYARSLRRVLGPDLDDAEVRSWTRRAFRYYGRYWLEGARLPAVAPELVRQRFHLESGRDHLDAAMAAGQGAVMALPHVGAWEWGAAWLALEGYPMTAVAEVLEPPELDEWFVSQRQAIGLTIVPLGSGAGGVLLKTLGDGKLVGLLCDRDIEGNGVDVEFFGERTTLPAGPAVLGLRTGAPILPTAVYAGPGRDHTAVILPPVPAVRRGRLRDDVARVTQDVARALEVLIRRAPDQWYMFQPNWPSDRCALPSTAPTA
ncbi:MAG TPA: phosphatidylinositol mannoside acyltransferase, partial [Acidimicrobiales bacterium]|nr:phosphatidylinositol mannoside acyltransferase [Acidimicrobiales bacterium]